jgi:predicted 3-demethylubiquinone-9 3-methyltransferase (glyoxalase superfamily)
MTNTLTNQKIVPHLWFDKEAQEAAKFYASIFPESSYEHVTTLQGTPSGDCDVVKFTLWGQQFMAISAGPYFKFTPAISFFVNFDPLFFGQGPDAKKKATEKLDQAWAKLSEGGEALMPLDKYPFSEHYGWIKDKYGLTWQLILTDPAGEPRPPIAPSLMFVGGNAGRAEEAIKLYLSVFKNSEMGQAHRYGPNMAPDKEGTIMFADFKIEDTWFAAMDSAHEHNFQFNEAVSLMVNCTDQKEIDYYTSKLSAVPAAEQCGWIKDKFGVSWQITPYVMNDMLAKGTPEQVKRLTEAFMPMKKFDLQALEKAFAEK